jgi:CheY-like chemotaxis protein
MDSHDGTVTVESRVGEGTTFCLYFPEREGAAVKVPTKEAPAPLGHGERILVVDDEEVLAVLVQRALTQLGYQAEFLTEPSAAVDRVRSDPLRFALVLTDQTMPAMTGLLLAAEIRKINPRLPVLMMTGYTAPLLSGRAKAAGIRELLLKPVTLHSLGVAVHRALSTATPFRSPPGGPTGALPLEVPARLPLGV